VPLVSLVNQVTGNYYTVEVNTEVPIELLEVLLKNELKKNNILSDFEYGVYDCTHDKIIYGNYISSSNSAKYFKPNTKFPKWDNKSSYFFGVYFPKKSIDLFSQSGVWIFSSIVLLIVCFFFAYSVFIILKQKRLSEIQTDFVNNMTHEFKTPISAIQITNDLLKKPAVYQSPELMEKYTSIIKTEVLRIKDQIEKVLKVAILEKEKIEYNIEPSDIHQCINNAISGISILLNLQQGKIEVSLTAVNSIILGDKIHLTNIFYNLFENAIKYSNQQPSILIKTENHNDTLIISIKDNGIGIKKEHLKRIFTKFYRIPTGNIHNVKGFGIGLYYVKCILKVHKGSINVQSELGKGTIIRIILPVLKKFHS
jgi:two-component system phosphate regulon sensor histidine kinase PhoR